MNKITSTQLQKINGGKPKGAVGLEPITKIMSTSRISGGQVVAN